MNQESPGFIRGEDVNRGGIYLIISKIHKNQRGSVLLEFALVVPLFFCLVFSIINVGVYAYNKSLVSTAVRSAGRAAVGSMDIPTGVVAGEKTLALGMGLSNTSLNISQGGDRITIQAKADIPVLVPGAAVLVGGSVWQDTIPITRSTTYNWERQLSDDPCDEEVWGNFRGYECNDCTVNNYYENSPGCPSC